MARSTKKTPAKQKSPPRKAAAAKAPKTSSAAPRAAKGTRTAKDKWVIEGVPPLDAGLSALAALASALEAAGRPVPLATLLVAGGEAFRLFVQTGRSVAPSSSKIPAAGVAVEATTFAPENLLETTCRELGIQADVIALDAKPGETRSKALWQAIDRSVRAGMPVPACGCKGTFEHEWCLVTGFDPEHRRALFRDVTHRLELYAQGPVGEPWQGWMPGPAGRLWMPHVLIRSMPKKPVHEARLAERVVARAVASARVGTVPPCWIGGLAAYDVWMLHLGHERRHQEAANHLREPALANSWLLLNTFAGRRAAGQFLASAARHFAGRKNAAVHKAAKLYSAAAGALQTAGALFPNWGHGYEEPDRRARQIELLAIAAQAERDATDALDDAFGCT
ncbi:MAG: hypothetical protein GXY74_04115 [Phycisphaerae bacterium]|nr:hypothetical protein [Phycisphaerae bacterium]